MIVGSQVPRLLRAWGYKPILFVASVIIALSQLLLAFIPADGNYWANLLPGFVLLGIGAGAVFGPITVAATSGVHWSQTGLASGLVNTSQQLGGSLGLAILTGASTSVATSFDAGAGTKRPCGSTRCSGPRAPDGVPHLRRFLGGRCPRRRVCTRGEGPGERRRGRCGRRDDGRMTMLWRLGLLTGTTMRRT
jgi:hypothetical protein